MTQTSDEIFTRAQYLQARQGIDDPRLADRAAATAHRRYYAQFVTEDTCSYVEAHLGRTRLAAALRQDQHLNSIALSRWDALCSNHTDSGRHGQLHVFLPYDRTALALAEGRDPRDPAGPKFVSQGDLVCIAKEAARQIVEADS